MADDPVLRLAEEPEDLGGLQEQAREVLARIQALYASLAADPDPGGLEEDELRRLFAVRDSLVQRLGFAALRVVAAGGQLVAQEEASEPEPIAEEPPQAPEDDTPTFDDDVEDVAVEVEPPPPPAAEPPKPKPADTAALLALVQGGLAPNWSQRRTPTADQRALAELTEAIGKPTQIKKRADVARAVARIAEAVARLDAWLAQPPSVRQALIGLVASLARQVQDESGFGLPKAEDDQLRAAFSLMTAWSKEHRPGFVPGLSRHNSPDNGSWLEDARHWWTVLQQEQGGTEDEAPNPEVALAELARALEDGVEDRSDLRRLIEPAVSSGVPQSDPRLVAMLTPYQSLLRGAKGLKTLKSCLRDALRDEDDEQEHEDHQSPVPDDWALFDLTRGKHAVVIGGDPRPRAAERIRRAFGLARVQWEETDVRRVRALADRVRAGGVDLVIILRRFISHSEQDVLMPACAEGDVPVCVVDMGYGVTQVRLAMERYWASYAPADEAEE